MKMIICDDEAFCRDEIKNCIEHYENWGQETYELIQMASVEQLLQSLELKDCDIIFLDIEFTGKEQGLQAAQKIRDQNLHALIVLISAHFQYSLMGYRTGAFRYILKDEQIQDQMREALDAAREWFKPKHRPQILDKVGFWGNLDDICYVESKGHVLKLYLYAAEENETEYQVKGKLDDWEAAFKLEDSCRFLRIHKSYLVNMDAILRMERYQVVLNHGVCLPVPKNRYREILETYLNKRRML